MRNTVVAALAQTSRRHRQPECTPWWWWPATYAALLALYVVLVVILVRLGVDDWVAVGAMVTLSTAALGAIRGILALPAPLSIVRPGAAGAARVLG